MIINYSFFVFNCCIALITPNKGIDIFLAWVTWSFWKTFRQEISTHQSCKLSFSLDEASFIPHNLWSNAAIRLLRSVHTIVLYAATNANGQGLCVLCRVIRSVWTYIKNEYRGNRTLETGCHLFLSTLVLKTIGVHIAFKSTTAVYCAVNNKILWFCLHVIV